MASQWTLSVNDEDFKDGFGDELTWSAARSYWWLLLDAERLHVAPLDPSTPSALNAPWQGALDLLAFGKGWTDLPEELERWRIAGYPRADPILRFVTDNLGATVALLELYLKVFPWAETKIRQYLAEAGGATYPELENKTWNQIDLDGLAGTVRRVVMTEPNSASSHFVRMFMPWLLDPEGPLVAEVAWGDESHMSVHFAHLWSGSPETSFASDDLVTCISDARWRVEFARYTDWYAKLSHLLLEPEWSQLADRAPGEVDVFIAGVGHLGSFGLDPRTARLARIMPTPPHVDDTVG